MKALLHQASYFSWQAENQTLLFKDTEPQPMHGEVTEALVAWLQIEAHDNDNHTKSLRKIAKQIKWCAKKRQLNKIVLHSFAHLGGTKSNPEYAQGFLCDLEARLMENGYQVQQTPFGWSCSWKLNTYGNSTAKIFVSF
ncbi:MAG: hypothetical protein CMK59_05110 [Proteobacteria bacterium]|nr:hypothetical protein [Pseudomonadota bacterium]